MQILKVQKTNHPYSIVFLACLAVACTQAGIVMYTPSIPTLIAIFKTSYSGIAHTLTAYILGYAASVLILGGISDQIGVKKSYLITTAIFLVSSMALAKSPSTKRKKWKSMTLL